MEECYEMLVKNGRSGNSDSFDKHTYSDDEPLDLENEKYEIVGMGGTTLKPIFDWASENDRIPTAAVIFTDGGCEHFSESDDPGYPVLWMVTKGGAKHFAEFGDVVEFKAAS